MPDLEKVIKAWTIFRDSNPYQICDGKEFRAIREPEYCMGQMIEDTIALLKEREEKIKNRDESLEKARGEIKWLRGMMKKQEAVVRCQDCIRRGTYDCPVYVGGDGMCSEPDDWFCGDGERRDNDA